MIKHNEFYERGVNVKKIALGFIMVSLLLTGCGKQEELTNNEKMARKIADTLELYLYADISSEEAVDKIEALSDRIVVDEDIFKSRLLKEGSQLLDSTIEADTIDAEKIRKKISYYRGYSEQ